MYFKMQFIHVMQRKPIEYKVHMNTENRNPICQHQTICGNEFGKKQHSVMNDDPYFGDFW